MITSLENKKIKEIIKLKSKKYRDNKNKFIIETPNLVKEAYELGLLEEVYLLDHYNYSFDVDTYYVTSNVMAKISNLENSSILGVCKKKPNKGLIGKKYLLLDGIQDPGNLGTIIRCALGFEIDTIVLSSDTCDLYNDKVIRATEGALFKMNIIRDDLTKVISELKSKNITIYGTDVNGGVNIKTVGECDSFALIMGSEGNGVKSNIKQLVDKNLYIKTNKNLESLNVGVATGIILFNLVKL